MQLKRLDTNATLDLGARLLWTDEFEWSPVAQTVTTSTTGALLVSVALRQAGRPITLDGVASQAWYSWALCQQLAAWAAVPALECELTLRGVVRRVIFNQEQKGFEARTLHRIADSEYAAADAAQELLYLPQIRFLEVLPPAP